MKGKGKGKYKGPPLFSPWCARFMRAYFPVRDKIIFFIRKLEQFGGVGGRARLPGLIAAYIFTAHSRAPPSGVRGAGLGWCA
jgi:hypothetical protein